MDLTLNFILKLQLEQTHGKYYIVNHVEIHSAQDMISQMPIIGGFYDHSLRNAVGQMTMAGTSFLQYTGVLDMMPEAVNRTKSTAWAVRGQVGSIASNLSTTATGVAGSALERTGMDSFLGGLINTASGYVKWGAGKMIEEGRGQTILCYSVSCAPGKVCYSPTCPRGQSIPLSKDSLAAIVRGLYSTAAKSVNQ